MGFTITKHKHLLIVGKLAPEGGWMEPRTLLAADKADT